MKQYQLKIIKKIWDRHVELDETAALISYEEYYPYGDTSYQSGRNQAEAQRKRYRYTGKEKDEETGLYYHGARYYAPWLGRWTAADPSGIADGPNLYAYVNNQPIRLVDPDGKAGVGDFWNGLIGGINSANSSVHAIGNAVTNRTMDHAISAVDKAGLSGTARNITLTGAAFYATAMGTQVELVGMAAMAIPNLLTTADHAKHSIGGGVSSIASGHVKAGAKQLADVTGALTAARGVREGVRDLQKGNYSGAAEKIGFGTAGLAGQVIMVEGALTKGASVASRLSRTKGKSAPTHFRNTSAKTPESRIGRVPDADAVPSQVASSGGATTSLYRAVGPSELADIEATRRFQNLGSAEGKYFTTSPEAASAYAKQAVRAFGDEPYTIVETEAPTSILKDLLPAEVDRGIPAWVIPNDRLPGLIPKSMNSMPLPQARF